MYIIYRNIVEDCQATTSLRSKRFQSSYCANVRAEAKKKVFLHSPPPPPSFIFFFYSCPSFLDEPREETLATQARPQQDNICHKYLPMSHLR